jgi:hypothetical protein
MKHYLLLPLLLIALLSSPCFSQEKKDLLTNANVVSLFKAGLSTPVILTTIRNSDTNFDVSTNAIIALKNDGVPDAVIQAIINKQAANPLTTTSTGQSNSTGGDQTLNNLQAGIYYEDPMSNTKTQLDENVFSQSKSGSFVLAAVTYGIAKTKAKASLSGAQANFQIPNADPVFYFIFPANNGGNSIGNERDAAGWFDNATNPNEFLLIKFKVTKKSREVVTGSFGSYSGFSSGIADDDKVAYHFSKVSPGVYKVYFESPLQLGEYAFIFAGASAGSAYSLGGGTTSQKAFDFSVTR